jgi:glycopeptide antibiotics resistance protein
VRGFNVLPWLVPGLIVSAIVGLVAGRRVGRVFGTSPAIGWGLIVGFGLVVSATLTPLRAGLDFQNSGIGTCDFSRIGIAPLGELVHLGDTSLNVLLFIPLGLAIGLVPGSRRRNILALVAVLSPVAIEATQLVLPVLGRGCQSADVFDNLSGLVLGSVIGAGARILGGWTETPPGAD